MDMKSLLLLVLLLLTELVAMVAVVVCDLRLPSSCSSVRPDSPRVGRDSSFVPLLLHLAEPTSSTRTKLFVSFSSPLSLSKSGGEVSEVTKQKKMNVEAERRDVDQ